MMRKKAWRVRCVMENQKECVKLALVNFTTGPLDHLWHKIQRLDEQGGAFKDVLFPRTNPFWLAYSDIVAMLRDLEPAHPLFAIFWRFAPEPESDVHMELLEMARQMLCSMTSQLLCSEWLSSKRTAF